MKKNIGTANLVIRQMSIDDLAAVFHLGEQIFTSEYSSSMYRTWDEYEITTLFNSDSDLCLVAELDDEVVGFALGTTVEKHNSSWKYGYLVWIGVRPGLQKCGAGNKLFDETRERMVDQGVRMIIIDTDADNEAGCKPLIFARDRCKQLIPPMNRRHWQKLKQQPESMLH